MNGKGDCIMVDPNVRRGSKLSKILNMPKTEKRMWSRMEDDVLLEKVNEYRGKHWREVAKCLQYRNAKQCSDRWNTQLKNQNRWNTSPWTGVEDETLLAFHRLFGNKWTRIAIYIPSRNATSIKNRYRSITRNQ